MTYQEEFEFDIKEVTYYVSVNFNEYGSVQNFSAFNSIGEEISKDDVLYEEIEDEVNNREYSFTDFSSSHEFYDQQLDHFDKDTFSLKDL